MSTILHQVPTPLQDHTNSVKKVIDLELEGEPEQPEIFILESDVDGVGDRFRNSIILDLL